MIARSLAALGVVAISLHASAQTIPAGPGPAPGDERRIAYAAFDCGNPEPQPNGNHGTLQMILGGGPFMVPYNGQNINLCDMQGTPCLLFQTPTGQRVFERMSGTPQVLDGGPELDPAQINYFRTVGYDIMKCHLAIQKKKDSGCKYGPSGACIQ
jgi:hypothetical protein